MKIFIHQINNNYNNNNVVTAGTWNVCYVYTRLENDGYFNMKWT